jgi:hypothetical protein
MTKTSLTDKAAKTIEKRRQSRVNNILKELEKKLAGQDWLTIKQISEVMGWHYGKTYRAIETTEAFDLKPSGNINQWLYKFSP